jgi:hypothetical protein
MAFSIKACSFPRFSPCRLSKPHSGGSDVLVDASLSQWVGEGKAGELRALIGIEDVRF